MYLSFYMYFGLPNETNTHKALTNQNVHRGQISPSLRNKRFRGVGEQCQLKCGNLISELYTLKKIAQFAVFALLRFF